MSIVNAATGEEVTFAWFEKYIYPDNDRSEDPIGVEFDLNEPITEPGTYTTVIAANYFIFDEVVYDKDIELTYTIAGETNYTYTVSPEEGAITPPLESFTINCETGFYVVSQSLSGIKIYKDDSTSSYTSISYINSIDDDNWWYYSIGYEFVLSTPLTEDGKYEIVIPADFFYYFVDTTGLNDIPVDEIHIIYTIGEVSGINTINGLLGEGVTEIYDLSGRRINEAQKGKINIVKYSDGSVKKVLLK